MRVRVLLFAGLREAVGSKDLDLELADGTSLGGLLSEVEASHPVVERYRGRLLISLNADRVPLETLLADGDEVALLPPVSGGAGASFVRASPLSMDELLERVRGPGMGGLCTFTGVVRNEARGEAIDHLEYEAYPPMAERELQKIVEQIAERWPPVRIALSHRVGRLEIGDAAVMIAAAAPHRADAFEACRFAIDTLKQSVPIWKKEFATSGAYWVEENP
jgi:molybdopterin synthase catalytic subunit/molybdopterin converting factor small subunit